MTPFSSRLFSGATSISLSQRVATVGEHNRRARRWNATKKRGGQALILAVFIMLFAALLSSTFLVLVASNTQSVGRSIDKTSARSHADEGAQAARRLMASSNDADHWQPESELSLMGDGKGTLDLDELPPAPGDLKYDEYWTPLDKAMGWALTASYSGTTVDERLKDLQNIKKNGGRVYIKVPDPRYSREATHYMLESRLLSDAVDEVTDGGDKKFMLRVTSLGFSPENPEVWARQLLYKATNLNGSTFSYANFVSNYDFTKKAFASTQLTGDVSSNTTTIALKDLGTFDANSFAPGQSLMLSDGDGDPFTSLIARRDATTVTLKTATPRPFTAAATTASVVANLTSGLDAINDNGARAALDPNDPLQKVLAPIHAEVENNPAATTDAAAFGNGNFYNLGLKVGERAQFAARPPYARSWGSYKTYSGQNALTVTGPIDRPRLPNGKIDPSGDLSLFDVTKPNIAAQTPPALSAEQNKYFRLSFTPQGAMQVDKYLPEVDPLVAPRPVTPASINLNSYKTNAGLLIDNPDDFEKIGSAPLDNSQLQRLWQRKSFAVAGGGNIAYTGTNAAIGAGTDAMRLAWPRPGVDSYKFPMLNGSLEQKAIRGWISPWEFLPRGVLVELLGNQIKITADPLRDDGTIDPAKQSVNGPQPAPANGILCATGNIRVRGNWTGTPLTIVSGHNIYIEGAINAEPGKVALLAKNNVTVNPTQFLQRPAEIVDRNLAATPVEIASQSGSNVTLAAGNVGRFKAGDAVALSNNNLWVTVSSISGDTLTLSSNPGTANTGIKLRQLTDPEIVMLDKDGKEVTTAATATAYAYALGKNSDNIYRNVLNDGVKVNVGLRQAAERVEVSIKGTASSGPFYLHVKKDHDSSNLIEPNLPSRLPQWPEMVMQGTYKNGSPYQTDNKGGFTFDLHNLDYPSAASSGDTQATLSQLKTRLASIKFKSNDDDDDDDDDDDGGGATKTSAWELTLPTSTDTPNPYGAVPMRRLASFSETDKPSGHEFKVPLTTSVGLFWNDTNTPGVTYGSFWGKVATEAAQDRPESLGTVQANYYGNAPKWDNLLARTNTSPTATISLQRDVIGDPNGLLPRHYYAGLHLEGIDAANPNAIAPLYSPKIGATIYAESGSWFVIPMPAQTTELNNPQAGRWRRSFYKLSVEGNIAQGFSPTAAEDYDNEPDPDGVAVGATKRWLDTLACPSNIVGGLGAVGNWQTISYLAKPIPLSNELSLPSTAEVLYTFVE